MTGAADQEAERGLEHLDERPDVAEQRADLGQLRGELLLGRLDGGDIDGWISERSLARAVGFDDDPRTRGHVITGRLEDRHHADRPLFLQRHPEGAGHLGRAVRRFDEHLDRAVAAEAETPDFVVVGREVPSREARPALLHDDLRHVGDVALQAAARDVADRGAILRDQQSRTGPSVGRAAHGDDRRERHPLAFRGRGIRSPGARRRSRSRARWYGSPREGARPRTTVRSSGLRSRSMVPRWTPSTWGSRLAARRWTPA